MSIDEQIEAAWKDGEPWIADDDYPMVPKEQLIRLIKEMFKDGYLAALRLFVLNPGEWIAMDNSEPPQVWVWYGDRDETAEPIRRLHLPTPAEVFGEGG